MDAEELEDLIKRITGETCEDMGIDVEEWIEEDSE